MRLSMNHRRPCDQNAAASSQQFLWFDCVRRLACLIIAVAALAGLALPGQQPPINGSYLPPMINQPPSFHDQTQMSEQQAGQQSFAAANAQRKKQIAEDSAKLLKLAIDLKNEVDKTTQDTLSLAVIRKADAIEKLARNVKEKMKLAVGAN